MIEEPVNAAPHSISSGPGRMSGLNHSVLPWPRLVWLTWLRKLHLSTVRATLIRMLMQLKRPRWRKRGESQSQPSDDPDRLAIVLVKGPPQRSRVRRAIYVRTLGRLQERQQEIEISCASAHDAHPDGGEVEMALRPQPPRQ
ncbi:hypothetical protein CK203_035900 [Vitis vinifera]|uniref:Uncharacterized protein n=1 Tax=Vitis vinifera TaxID=29760 RepID=A0A438I043_VITVI|nr:hypothetical protein CK203_035900 [Vitis vinifera]